MRRTLSLRAVPLKVLPKTMTEAMQAQVWAFLEHPQGTWPSTIFHTCWNSMSALSVCCAFASASELTVQARQGLNVINLVCTVLFTVEFAVKLVASGPRRHNFLKCWYTMVDILIIVQGYISWYLDGYDHAVLKLLETQVCRSSVGSWSFF